MVERGEDFSLTLKNGRPESASREKLVRRDLDRYFTLQSVSATSVWLCPTCQTPLTVVERLTAVQIAWRFTAKRYLDTS
jgi:hypothetical protein